jgi:hypothetical protein
MSLPYMSLPVFYCHAILLSLIESYKSLVEKWPDREWCEKRLKALNPKLFDISGPFA